MSLVHKTDWNSNDDLNPNDFNRIEGNIQTLEIDLDSEITNLEAEVASEISRIDGLISALNAAKASLGTSANFHDLFLTGDLYVGSSAEFESGVDIGGNLKPSLREAFNLTIPRDSPQIIPRGIYHSFDSTYEANLWLEVRLGGGTWERVGEVTGKLFFVGHDSWFRLRNDSSFFSNYKFLKF